MHVKLTKDFERKILAFWEENVTEMDGLQR